MDLWRSTEPCNGNFIFIYQLTLISRQWSDFMVLEVKLSSASFNAERRAGKLWIQISTIFSSNRQQI